MMFKSVTVWVCCLWLNQLWFDLDSSQKMFDSSVTQVFIAAAWVLKGLQPVFGRLPHVDQSRKNFVNPFSWCVCWNGGMIFVVLWGCRWLMCLKVFTTRMFCPSFFFIMLPFWPPPPFSPSCVTHMWSLSLPGSCLCSLGALVSSFLYLFGFLRFSPRNSVPALGQGSACTGTTTGREGWGGWVCPSIALPVGFNLFVCVCVRP